MFITDSYDELLEKTDAVLIATHPSNHVDLITKALKKKKHVLCEAPIALDDGECRNLFELAHKNECILMDAIKTAYATAYNRILLMARDGRIGDIVSIDATCTSLSDPDYGNEEKQKNSRNSILAWGPYALLPIFQILGTDYKQKMIMTRFLDEEKKYDQFTKVDFIYEDATASIKVAKAAKSEGELIISGTKGYIYVPAPWWKTDYYEVRYENPENNKKYFYQLDGEGIRYEIVAFVRSISTSKNDFYISPETSIAIAKVMKDYINGTDRIEI